jgi:sugar phosphate isomerase/epimerase
LSDLEFELDNRLDEWPAFTPLMISAYKIGLQLSFHAPYRPPHSLVGFSGEERSNIQNDTLPLFEIAENWAKQSDACNTVVIHAAIGKEPADRKKLVSDTKTFLEWVLETFPHLRLALENNHPARPGEVKIGVDPIDVLSIISSIASPRLGACWDLGHDYLRHIGVEPTREWLEKVIHIHVHDVDHKGDDHFPLVFGNVPYKSWLQKWKMVGGKGKVILELKGGQLKDGQPAEITDALKKSITELSEVLG